MCERRKSKNKTKKTNKQTKKQQNSMYTYYIEKTGTHTDWLYSVVMFGRGIEGIYVEGKMCR